MPEPRVPDQLDREWPRFAAENFAGEGSAQNVFLASLLCTAEILIATVALLSWPARWIALAVAVPVVAFVTLVLVDTIRGWRIDRRLDQHGATCANSED